MARNPLARPSTRRLVLFFLLYALIPSPETLALAFECNPSVGCDVCAACCHEFIPAGAQCDTCHASKCTNTLAPTLAPTPAPTSAPTPELSCKPPSLLAKWFMHEKCSKNCGLVEYLNEFTDGWKIEALFGGLFLLYVLIALAMFAPIGISLALLCRG